MKGQSISCDVKGPRTEDCDSHSKEPPGPETDYSCRLWRPPSLEDHHETPGLPKAAYADKRHLPGSAPPSVTLDCESDQQFPKLEISLTEIMNADVPSVEVSKANALDGHRLAQGSPSTSSQRRSLFAEFGSQDATLLSRSKSFLDFWRLASSEGCSVDSPRSKKSRRPGPSSTSPAASTDESRLSKASRTTLFIALLIPCAVIGLIVLVVIHARPKSPQVRHALWIDELVNACVTVDCHSAVWELSSSVDLSKDPCKDFYSFACGHWANVSSATVNEAKRHDSYMAIQRRAYVTEVNAILLKVRRRASSMVSGGITQHIADVYRSCLKFIHEQPVNLSEAMRALGIEPPIWTAATTFAELFALAVRHTLFYNATSAINVLWARNSTNTTSQAIVEISPGVSMAQRMGSSSRRSLVARALAIIENYATTDRMDAIESIDDALAASTSNICPRTDVTEMSLDELDTPRTKWSSIVGEYVKLTGREELPSKARIVNLPDVRAVLDVLENSSIPELQLYLMLVPLSEFFVLEDQVQRQEPASVDDSEESDAMKCVRALELLFGDHYCQWVWAHVQKPGTSSDVHRMWEQVRQETNSLIQFRREIRTEHNVSAPPIGNDACHPGFASSASHQSGELAVLPSQYSDDFVSNVILFSQKSSAARSGCEPFLSPESLAMKWSDRETFFRLLVPDFYHAEATEVAVNYATLGFFLSEFAIRAELPSRWNWTVHGSCLARPLRNLQQLPNFRLLNINLNSMVKDSVLVHWYLKDDWNHSPFRVNHLSDALRLLVLWKYGGVYADMDVLTLKSFSELRNVVARELFPDVGNSVMVFDKGHPFLSRCLQEFSSTYKARKWAHNGPRLLERVLSWFCPRNLLGKVPLVPLSDGKETRRPEALCPGVLRYSSTHHHPYVYPGTSSPSGCGGEGLFRKDGPCPDKGATARREAPNRRSQSHGPTPERLGHGATVWCGNFSRHTQNRRTREIPHGWEPAGSYPDGGATVRLDESNRRALNCNHIGAIVWRGNLGHRTQTRRTHGVPRGQRPAVSYPDKGAAVRRGEQSHRAQNANDRRGPRGWSPTRRLDYPGACKARVSNSGDLDRHHRGVATEVACTQTGSGCWFRKHK
ncbi:hypothetical protein HPB52_005863 [Rhipicephalus sanguineus]|uniref:Alpha-1,4-N-acetylglucosaminyltransferase n=1 Tax=Rhipicephalus sanguineus TaxID=34632 RepID=A0A9D4SQ18_RHISA|nr:hypothetical protein HPB52_005863 [Rhipicephalus sanguineus]